MRFAPLGDTAVTVELGEGMDARTLAQVRALARVLETTPPAGVTDVVASFATVTVFYDVARSAGYEALCADIAARGSRLASVALEEGRAVRIPVCYAEEFAPDLARVAAHAGLDAEEVVRRHSGADYVVCAVGFAPGFGYLGGLPDALQVPRLATPRTNVPAGSVGIGGAQTGVYPLASPGGWNLIGRTPLALFRPAEREPALLRTGDRVKFEPITREEFAAWK